MSRTIRKDGNDENFSESLKKRYSNAKYKCKRDYHTNASKKVLTEKIAEKEFKNLLD